MGEREGTNKTGGDKTGGETHDEAATSSETLGDLEKSESDAATESGSPTTGESSDTGDSTPSPDGAFDSPGGGRADGSDAGEPM